MTLPTKVPVRSTTSSASSARRSLRLLRPATIVLILVACSQPNGIRAPPPPLNPLRHSTVSFVGEPHFDAAAYTDAQQVVCKFQMPRIGDTLLAGKVTVLVQVTLLGTVRRQASMFNKLQARFRNANFTHVQFVIVRPDNETMRPDDCGNNNNGTAAEAEEDSPSANEAVDDGRPKVLEERYEAVESEFNVTVLRQVNAGCTSSASGGWFVPGAAYVFDPCGQFTYVVYWPWSSIQRPYVKAAILSTIYDDPCGNCGKYPGHHSTSSSQLPNMQTEVSVPTSTPTVPVNMSSTTIPISNVTNSSSNPKRNAATPANMTIDPSINGVFPNNGHVSTPAENITFVDNTTAAYVMMPIRVIAPIVHAHRQIASNDGNSSTADGVETPPQYYLKYNYIEMRSNDKAYHAHLASDKPERLSLVPPQQPMPSTAGEPQANDDGGHLAAIVAIIRPADDDQEAAESASALVMQFVTDYGKRYVSVTKPNSAPPQHQGSEDLSAARRPEDEFVLLEEMSRSGKQRERSNTLRTLSDTQSHPNEEHSTTHEQQLNQHYSQMIQWIQFSL